MMSIYILYHTQKSQFTKMHVDGFKERLNTTLAKRYITDDIRMGSIINSGKISSVYSQLKFD